jgi:hypothetical protein
MHMQVGPRLDLELVKVQDGLASGSVLYHRYEQRSAGDVAAQEVARADAERLRAARRQEQEANVRRKAAERARAERAKQVRDVWSESGQCRLAQGALVRNKHANFAGSTVENRSIVPTAHA